MATVAELEAAIPDLLMQCNALDRVLERATGNELEAARGVLDDWVRRNPEEIDPKKLAEDILRSVRLMEAQKGDGMLGNVFDQLMWIAARRGRPFRLRRNTGEVIYETPAGMAELCRVIIAYRTIDLVAHYTATRGD